MIVEYMLDDVDTCDMGDMGDKSYTGKNEDDKTTTNIWRNTHLNYSNVFYKGDDSEIVLQRLNIFINTLLSVE